MKLSFPPTNERIEMSLNELISPANEGSFLPIHNETILTVGC